MHTFLADIREYVFPLFVVDDPALLSPGQPTVVTRDAFLGTAFFVARNGLALTAAHCAPDPATLAPGKSIVAAVWDGERPLARRVQQAFCLDRQDIAVLKVDHSSAKFLPVSFDRVTMGDDVVSVGVPMHSVSGEAFEYRCLKGHVTFVSKTLELSYPAPRGMSGSPVFREGVVVGVISWNARAEALEDQSHERTESIGPITRVTKTITMAVTNYGQAEPIARLRDTVLPVAGGLTFKDVLQNESAA